MKELSIEEKAKRYDESIERAKEKQTAYKELFGDEYSGEDIVYIFPELKGSEDERIKRAILEFFESQDENTTYSFVPRNDIIAWLRKQKESKPIEQKATWSVGDEVKLKSIIALLHHPVCIEDNKGVIGLMVDWLKSIKDRMTWRPTEEQMEALGDAVKLYKSTHFDSYHIWGYKIETLYNDLRKLL